MSARRSVALAILALLPVGSVSAENGIISGDRADFLRVVTNAPALQAAARRTTAARERVDASGRLADVEVEGMASRMVGPMDERSTMWEVNVRQPLPKRGERAASRDRARAGVSLAEADYAVMAGELAADTALALAEVAGAQARIRILETQLGRLDAMLRGVDARISTGGGRLADRLTVKTRIGSMQLLIEEEQRIADDGFAAARGRLGLEPDATLPGYVAPNVGEINATDAATLAIAAARTEEANASAKLAKASSNPLTAVGVRFERERRAMGDENTVGVAFMSEIPWRSRGYARAEARAAEAERAAAQSDASAARYRISAALTRIDRAERLAATARRLNAETRERLDAEFDALIRSASAGSPGESTLLQTVEILDRATDTELQVVRAETAVHAARAELWRHVPANLFVSPIR